MRMSILLPLFKLTVQYERLDKLTNLIVRLGGAENRDRFYDVLN